jgi:ribokinase
VILVFGSVNLDLIVPVPVLPGPGETVLGEALRLEPGGKGANQAVAAARDGATVAFAGAVGEDDFAAQAFALLRSSGVDLARLATVRGATGAAVICVDPAGRNQIAVAPGANRFARATQIADADLCPGTTLLLQMEVDPGETAALIARARARGTRIVLSLAPPLLLPRPSLAAVDILLVNAGEAEALASALGVAADPEALRAALGGPDVVVTRGEAGSVAATGAGLLHQPAFRIEAVDTTAAGDTFAGVLAASLDRGEELPAALRRAAAAAALACTRRGAQASIPLAAETDRLVCRGVSECIAP